MSKWSDVKIYDLSIPIGVNCPPWPTYEPVQMKFFKRLSSNGANGQILTHSNHVGTHLDGPLHFDTSGRTVDQLELTKLVHGEEEAAKAQEAARALMMERLQEALATLTPRQASCLHARFWEGKPFKEIAEAEGFTTSAAIVTVRNAIIKLQKYYIKRGWMKPPKEKAICTKTAPPKRNRKKTSEKKS